MYCPFYARFVMHYGMCIYHSLLFAFGHLHPVQSMNVSVSDRPAEAALSTLGALLNLDYLYPQLTVNILGAIDDNIETSMMKVKDSIVKLLLQVACSFESESVPLRAR